MNLTRGGQGGFKSRDIFFRCSVSEDLYGASKEASGVTLPTPSGGKWLLVDGLGAIDGAAAGYDTKTALRDIEMWGCHWFTSNGPRDINWGEGGAPVPRAGQAQG